MNHRSILHIANSNDWLAAKDSGEYVPAGFEAEGFIHCCFDNQLDTVLETYFAGNTDCVILELNVSNLGDNLRLERGQDGQTYPHVYSPVKLADIREVQK